MVTLYDSYSRSSVTLGILTGTRRLLKGHRHARFYICASCLFKAHVHLPRKFLTTDSYLPLRGQLGLNVHCWLSCWLCSANFTLRPRQLLSKPAIARIRTEQPCPHSHYQPVTIARAKWPELFAGQLGRPISAQERLPAVAESLSFANFLWRRVAILSG